MCLARRIILCYMRAIKTAKKGFFITQFLRSTERIKSSIASLAIQAFFVSKLYKHFMFLCEFLSRFSHVSVPLHKLSLQKQIPFGVPGSSEAGRLFSVPYGKAFVTAFCCLLVRSLLSNLLKTCA